MPRSHPWRDAPDAVAEATSLRTSWEKEFGLVQGVQSGNLVFLSGQLGIDEAGIIVGKGMETGDGPSAHADKTLTE